VTDLAILGLVMLLVFIAGMAFLRIPSAGSLESPTHPQRVPFLGGGSQDAHAWQRFHARFYSMLLLFIAFEMEMMFMYPWAVVFVAEGMKAMVEMGMFLGILSVGILYGWREGILKWQ
jgi:NADH-quinone oxidoreductase subunit A